MFGPAPSILCTCPRAPVTCPAARAGPVQRRFQTLIYPTRPRGFVRVHLCYHDARGAHPRVTLRFRSEPRFGSDCKREAKRSPTPRRTRNRGPRSPEADPGYCGSTEDLKSEPDRNFKLDSGADRFWFSLTSVLSTRRFRSLRHDVTRRDYKPISREN